MADEIKLEGGTYEILRNRLTGHAGDLRARLERLNEARKAAFGKVEAVLLDSFRITTANNCTPRDVYCLGERFIFGYNVQFGLKSTVEIGDVFGIFEQGEHGFVECGFDLLQDSRFLEDFASLYKYYKNTVFARFQQIGPHLYMVFQTGRSVTDIKTFKWLLKDGQLTYLDNRSDHECRFPEQHEFQWKRTHRDQRREGRFPHLSIEDRVFIETTGGDLTVKIEDNTETGRGIYAEPVEHPEQSLDDAEFFYAIVGPLILLKVRPYQEKNFRYLIYNEKLKTVVRIDAIEKSCILLPDSQGLIFSNGFVLQNGEMKIFDHSADDMMFSRRIPAPNGEDYLYVFHHREHGSYILLSYNLIEQTVATPVICHGYSLFADGRMLVIRGETEPSRHHMVQVWQTPFLTGAAAALPRSDSPLAKVGNREVVRAMAECGEILKLCERGEAYELVYTDIVRLCTGVLDSYFWVSQPWAENLTEALQLVRGTAAAAVDEFRKVVSLRRQAKQQVDTFQARATELLAKVRHESFSEIGEFVEAMTSFRSLRGQVGTLREVRYADLQAVETTDRLLQERADLLAQATVDFLLRPEALEPFQKQLAELGAQLAKTTRGVEVAELGKQVDETARGLDLLIDVVSNLKIDDPTRSASIIDRISTVYAGVNQQREAVKSRRRELAGSEAVAEFGAQIKLLGQSVVNFLDVADTPERVDEYLNKLLVQVETMEGRFADFDDFVLQLSEKREEISAAFEARKLALVEARNRRASTLQTSASRILNGIRSKAESLKEVEEIHSYFATDLMVEKVRDIMRQLSELGDTVKADELGGRLKATLENAVRQLKDRRELFADGANTIRLGRHVFSVNTQPLDLTVLQRDGRLVFHLTGTNFFEPISDPEIEALRAVWDQELRSETATIYRAEYLAHVFRSEHPHIRERGEEALLPLLQQFMTPRYQEGYLKGVHDLDAAKIAAVLYDTLDRAGVLRWGSGIRAAALFFWEYLLEDVEREALRKRLQSVGALRRVFPNARIDSEKTSLQGMLHGRMGHLLLFPPETLDEAAAFLMALLGETDDFPVAGEAEDLALHFERFLDETLQRGNFDKTLRTFENDPADRFSFVRRWVRGFAEQLGDEGSDLLAFVDEAALHLLKVRTPWVIARVETHLAIEGLRGSHPRVVQGALDFDLPEFLQRLGQYRREGEVAFDRFQEMKRELIDRTRREMRLSEFMPRVLTSFVRNKLIDEVYLPRIGDNFAKQMGTVGATKRTDLMGMLLLTSPPGYGKTTLMEYLASRLGLVFMKINGPALGNRVHSIDPTEAPNAAAREELNKLNLAFEMGDNVMIYIDDIQHCHPEFLQKFISLCDGQRRIEGVYKGRARTYDLRGRKVCVVMAGNPYTESGDKFQIPDMLANRADTYNLGDIIGNAKAAFELSYIENSLTSNPSLARLASRSQADLYTFVRLADTGDREGLEFEGNYSAEEQNEIVAVIRKLRVVQSVILRVNQEYIRSAAQEDAYRTEPPFKLQGSYRNMNKLAEKVVAIMDDGELRTLVMNHYEGESQTLTGAAEFNLLKFREMIGWATSEELARLAAIREAFQRNQKLRGMEGSDPMVQMLAEVDDLQKTFERIGESVSGVQTALETTRVDLAGSLTRIGEGTGSVSNQLGAFTETVGGVAREIGSGLGGLRPLQEIAGLTDAIRSGFDSLTEARRSADTDAARMDQFMSRLRLAMAAAAARPVIVRLSQPGAPALPAAERASNDQLLTWLGEEGWQVTPLPAGMLDLTDERGTRLTLALTEDSIHFQAEAGQVPTALARHIYRELLALNTQILPLSIGLDRGSRDTHRLLILESRDRSILGREELGVVLRAYQSAVDAAKALIADLLAGAPVEE